MDFFECLLRVIYRGNLITFVSLSVLIGSVRTACVVDDVFRVNEINTDMCIILLHYSMTWIQFIRTTEPLLLVWISIDAAILSP